METDRHIKRILDLGKQANIAVFTTGPIKTDSLLFQLGYFSEQDVEMISSRAVGDICSRFLIKMDKFAMKAWMNGRLDLIWRSLRRKSTPF